MTAKNITGHALNNVDFVLHFYNAQNDRIKYSVFTIAGGEDVVEPGETFTVNDRADITEVFDWVVAVGWSLHINLNTVNTRDVRPEDERDELTPVPIIVLNEEAVFDALESGGVDVVGNGVVLNNSGMNLNALTVTVNFKGENGELLDWVKVPV